MDRSPDARLLAIARRQSGTFARSQAYSCGMTSDMLLRRSARGEIEQLDNDVWCWADAAPTWLRDCWAATLVHPTAALSHRTGATQLGLQVDRARPLHVTTNLDADHRSRSVEVHRSRHHLYASHEGLRVTRFEQVLVQMAGTAPELVEAALHSGVDDDPMRLDRLLRHLERLRRSRLPGLRQLRELAIDLEGDPPTQSELERRMLSIVESVPRMPHPKRQVDAPWAPASRSIVDAIVPGWSLILEADGRAFHQRRADFERDRWRDAEAAIHGFHVMRFTHRRMEHDRDGIVDQLVRFGRTRRLVA